MTEQEWLASENPAGMLRFLTDRPQQEAGGRGRNPFHPGDRKMRLLACACCRIRWDDLPDVYARKSVAVAERYADGLATRQEMNKARADSFHASEPDDLLLSELAWGLSFAGIGPVIRQLWSYLSAPRKFQAEVAILRELVGNPFVTVTIKRPLPWIALNLAQAAYADRDFVSLPVLADALEEAVGWVDQRILDHLRTPGPHVRGCWALDLVLGKE